MAEAGPSSGNPLYNYFTKEAVPRTSKEDQQHYRGICKKCKKVLVMNKGSTGGLLTHLKFCHTNDFTEYIKQKKLFEESKKRAIDDLDEVEAELGETPTKKIKSVMTQQSLEKFASVKKWPLKSEQQNEFDMVLTLSMASCSLPFNVVETEGFQFLVNYLQPRANMKKARTFSKFKLPLAYDNMTKVVMAQIQRDVPHCSGVAVTTDGWTSRSGDPYLSLTLHYIDPAFKLKKVSLKCHHFDSRHTGQAIAKEIDALILEYPALRRKDLTIAAVTDAASNVTSAIKLSKKCAIHLRCCDHALNNSLKAATDKTDAIKAIIVKCKRLAQRLHQSSQYWKALKIACLAEQVQKMKIVQPVETRWNSISMMVTSIVKMERPLMHCKQRAISKEFENSIPHEEEFETLKEIEPFLALIKKMSERWSSEKESTIHRLQVDIHNLIKKCATMQRTCSAQVDDFLGMFSAELLKRFPDAGASNNEIRLAAFLDPAYRGVTLEQQKHSSGQNYLEYVMKEISDKHESTHIFMNQVVSDTEAITQRSSDDESDDADVLLSQQASQGVQDETQRGTPPISLEIETYRTLPFAAKEANVLEWWSKHQGLLPLLTELARSVLCIPVTSASSERMFSAAGGIVTTSRESLDPNTASKLVFLQQNFHHVKTDIRKWQNEAEAEHEEQTADPDETLMPGMSQESDSDSDTEDPAAQEQDFDFEESQDVEEGEPLWSPLLSPPGPSVRSTISKRVRKPKIIFSPQ